MIGHILMTPKRRESESESESESECCEKV
jgi:hypothetical protein